MAFVVDLSRPKTVVAVFNTPVCFCFVCYLLLPDLRVLFFLRAPTAVVAEPKENLQLFYCFIATCRRLSSRVTKNEMNRNV